MGFNDILDPFFVYLHLSKNLIKRPTIKETIQKIAKLQLDYSSENTPFMKERGELIRNTLPEKLKGYFTEFRKDLGEYSSDLSIEGKDGIGRKTEAPWVRLFSKKLSPSATTGYYVVIHFSIDGKRCYVTIGCASTKWNNETGDLSKHSPEELKKKTKWARDVISFASGPDKRFRDKINLGAKAALPKSFENATALAELHVVETIDERFFINSIRDALRCLKIIYKASSQLGDVPTSEISLSEIESVINPNKQTVGNRQGFGLNAKERKAVETRAMDITKDYLIEQGFEPTDTSKNKPYDFVAIKKDLEIKVEVKGTTSGNVDSINMTHNEVELHKKEKGNTALAIVSNISLIRGKEPQCKGGILEFHISWDIDKWIQKPVAYQVFRPK